MSLLSIDSRRRVLSAVLDSIRVEDPEYVDEIASDVTRVFCELVEKNKGVPNRSSFLQKCSTIRTSFFRYNKVDRNFFFSDLYERLSDVALEFRRSGVPSSVNWDVLIAKIDLSEDLRMKILKEMKELRQEYDDSLSEILKTLLKLKLKTAVTGSQMENLRKMFQSFILIHEIEQRKRRKLLDRLKQWGKEVSLQIIGSFFYDVIKLIQ